MTWFWRDWMFAWGEPFRATGWPSSTQMWQIGPLLIVRFHQPTKETP